MRPATLPSRSGRRRRRSRGHVDLLEGRAAAGLARVREIHEQVTGSRAPAPGVPGVATRLLLQSYAIAGEPAAGLALADEALGMGHGAELWEAEIRRLRATFLAALGAPAGEVTAELERALPVHIGGSRESGIHSPPLSTYSAQGGLPQDPGHAA